MLIVELNHQELLEENLLVDGYIIGIEYLSSDCYQLFSLDEAICLIKKIKENNKLVFIDCTNLFSDFELKKAKEMIKLLNDNTDVDYFMYEDLGLMDIIDENKRFYYSLTYNTNQFDLDIVLNENDKALLSPLLTIDEVKKLNNSHLFFIAFGTWRIFYSRRLLLTNYYNYRMMEYHDANYQIIEETRPADTYYIKEVNGTKIYLHDYFYLNDELNSLSNVILKPFALELEKTIKVINLYLEKIKNKALNIDFKLTELGIKHHQGLLYEDAILIKKTNGGKNNEEN